MNCIKRFYKICFLLIFLGMMSACSGVEGEGAMQVWLESPLDGTVHDNGFPITLDAHARDVNGPGISEIQFLANGTLIAFAETDSSAPLVHVTYDWLPPDGVYQVVARAAGTGGTLDSAPVQLTISNGQASASEEEPAVITSTPTITTTPKTPTLTATPTQTMTPPPTATVTFNAGATTLEAGECTTLTWQTTNTYAVRLNGASVANQYGSLSVCPEQKTTYSLEADSANGTITRTVTINVTYLFPLVRVTDYATISISGGHGSVHHLGDTIQVCYSFNSAGYLFEVRNYAPATNSPEGATGSYAVLAEGSMYSSQNVCKNYTLVEPGGYEAYQIRILVASESPTPQVVGIAEVWIYTAP